MKKRFINLIPFFTVLFITLSALSGCRSNNTKETNTNTVAEEVTTKQEATENPFKITTEFDGVYSFTEQAIESTGKIHTTIGAFLFDNGTFTLKYYLNDRFSTLEEANGVFGFDNDNILKIKFNNGPIWDLCIDNGQLSYSERISAYKATRWQYYVAIYW